jgi:hypothetical protein
VTNEVRTLVEDRRDWTLLHQNTSVLARAGMSNSQHAVLLADGKATQLPRLRGGTALVGVEQVGGITYALVGHNTSNTGDALWTSMHEADVCILDTKKDLVEIETRSLPARYMPKSKAFWAAVNAIPNTRWQILDELGSPPMMHVNIDENGSSDVTLLRDRAREIHNSPTSGSTSSSRVRTSRRSESPTPRSASTTLAVASACRPTSTSSSSS